MTKAKLIDEINDAFIKVLTEKHSKAYANYIKAINRELIDNIDNLTASKVSEIISRQKINIDDMVLLFAVQNAILLIIDKPQEAKQNTNLLPIIALMGIYSITKPKVFAENVISVTKSAAQNKTAHAIIKEFQTLNAKILASARKQARLNLDKSVIKSKVTRRMIDDLNKGLEDKQSIEDIKKSLVRKYNNLSNIDRALDTELHAQSEYVRLEHSKSIGYTHKVWKTQGDERVRDTKWHKQVNGKKVPIDSDFKAAGYEAKAPGDERLPAGERIRCRCYLIYV